MWAYWLYTGGADGTSSVGEDTPLKQRLYRSIRSYESNRRPLWRNNIALDGVNDEASSGGGIFGGGECDERLEGDSSSPDSGVSGSSGVSGASDTEMSCASGNEPDSGVSGACVTVMNSDFRPASIDCHNTNIRSTPVNNEDADFPEQKLMISHKQLIIDIDPSFGAYSHHIYMFTTSV